MPKRVPKTKAGKKAKAAKVFHEFGQGKLRSGSKQGPKVTKPEQAVAIALSESGQSRKGKKGGVKRRMKPKKSAIKGKGYKD